MRWISVAVTKCFDGLLVPGEEIELEFQGRAHHGTPDTYYQPGDGPEFEINKVFLVVNGKTTDKEINLADDIFEKAYDDLLEKALDATRDDEGPEYEPENEREDRYEPDDYDTDYREDFHSDDGIGGDDE